MANDLLGEQFLLILRFEREQDFGVADGNAILGEPALDLGMQIEQAHAVRNRSPALADLLGDVFLAQSKLAGEAGEGIGFFNRIEVLALEVFDEGELENILVRCFAEDDRRFGKTDAESGAPAAFTGDQFKFIAALAGDERLNDSVLLDRGDEFLEVLIAKNGARLERGRDDAIEGHGLHPLAAFDGGRRGSHARVDERAEAFSECNFCHRIFDCRERGRERQLPFARSADKFARRPVAESITCRRVV